MKLSAKQLKRIVQEEVRKILNEQDDVKPHPAEVFLSKSAEKRLWAQAEEERGLETKPNWWAPGYKQRMKRWKAEVTKIYKRLRDKEIEATVKPRAAFVKSAPPVALQKPKAIAAKPKKGKGKWKRCRKYLKFDCYGANVEALQRKLIALGEDYPKVVGTPDKHFGPRTKEAVVNFQTRYSRDVKKISIDGIVGPQTRDAIKNMTLRKGIPIEI